MPLYRAGLWLAVNIAPGSWSRPEAKYSWSVEARPMSITSAPVLVTPSANAFARPGLDGRMSYPTTTVPPSASTSITSTNAAPTARAMSSSSWSGTTPRTSYALKIADVGLTPGD